MKRKSTIAQQLAKRFGGEWRAVRDGFSWRWEGPDGRIVRCYAESILDYDGYSDTEFRRVLIDNRGVQVGGCYFGNSLVIN